MASKTPAQSEKSPSEETQAENPQGNGKSAETTRKPAGGSSAQDPAEGSRQGQDKGQERQAGAASGASGSKHHQQMGEEEHGGKGTRASVPPAGPTSAIGLLMADHRAVEKLFDEYEDADETRRRAIIEEASQALILHTMLEEEIFYPACREHFTQEDPLDEAQVEHDCVKVLITDLLHGARDDSYRDAKFRVLAEQVRHHVREEEQSGGIFQKAKNGGIDTPDLARRIAGRHRQLEEGGPLPDRPPVSLGRFPGQGPGRHQPRYPGRDNEGRDQSRYLEEKEMASYQQYRDRDDRGRFTGSDEGDHWSDRRGNDRPRDEEGRFVSRGRGSGRDEEDDRDRGRYGRRGEQSYRRDEEDDRRYSGGRGHGGWFGDSEGHSEASRRGWENPDHGRSGWYGDSEGHSEASRRGWENPDHGRSGWFGDSEGHSEASRRGWDERGGSRSHDYEDDRRYSRSRSQGSDDRGYASRSRRDDEDDHRRHGGWSGDPRGHSEAARRGWENRR